MAQTRAERIAEMQSSMDRLQAEYGEEKAVAKKKKKAVAKPKKETSEGGEFSVFGLAAKIKRRKAENLKAATE